MKQTWDSDTIDSMIDRIEKLETDVKNLSDAGDILAGLLSTEHEALHAWGATKSKAWLIREVCSCRT